MNRLQLQWPYICCHLRLQALLTGVSSWSNASGETQPKQQTLGTLLGALHALSPASASSVPVSALSVPVPSTSQRDDSTQILTLQCSGRRKMGKTEARIPAMFLKDGHVNLACLGQSVPIPELVLAMSPQSDLLPVALFQTFPILPGWSPLVQAWTAGREL